VATKSRSKAGGSTAPRWTYVIGALASIGALLWAIMGHFIPKPEAAKPIAQVPTISVSASGAHSVAVGSMSGGQISVGTHPAPQSAASAGSTLTNQP
jgi:hypothetical protein